MVYLTSIENYKERCYSVSFSRNWLIVIVIPLEPSAALILTESQHLFCEYVSRIRFCLLGNFNNVTIHNIVRIYNGNGNSVQRTFCFESKMNGVNKCSLINFEHYFKGNKGDERAKEMAPFNLNAVYEDVTIISWSLTATVLILCSIFVPNK